MKTSYKAVEFLPLSKLDECVVKQQKKAVNGTRVTSPVQKGNG